MASPPLSAALFLGEFPPFSSWKCRKNKNGRERQKNGEEEEKVHDFIFITVARKNLKNKNSIYTSGVLLFFIILTGFFLSSWLDTRNPSDWSRIKKSFFLFRMEPENKIKNKKPKTCFRIKKKIPSVLCSSPSCFVQDSVVVRVL